MLYNAPKKVVLAVVCINGTFSTSDLNINMTDDGLFQFATQVNSLQDATYDLITKTTYSALMR